MVDAMVTSGQRAALSGLSEEGSGLSGSSAGVPASPARRPKSYLGPGAGGAGLGAAAGLKRPGGPRKLAPKQKRHRPTDAALGAAAHVPPAAQAPARGENAPSPRTPRGLKQGGAPPPPAPRSWGSSGAGADATGDELAMPELLPPVQARAGGRLLPDQVVWAKMQGSPWWPAQVQEGVERHQSQIPHKDGDVFVVFFSGTGAPSVAWLPPDKVEPFEREQERRAANGNKGLQKALQVARQMIAGRA